MLAAGLVEGLPLRAAAERAVQAATMSVTRAGARGYTRRRHLLGRHHGVERRVRRALAQGVEEFAPCSMPVRELVAQIPAPRGDHRENEDPALAEQFSISVRIALADRFGHMGEVELDGPTTTGLEVDEPRSVLRAEHVARVRLAVQQLLGGAAVGDRSPQASQRVAEQLPVRVRERRSEVAARNELLRLRNSIREVRRRDIDLPHTGMQPRERIRVVGR